MTLTRSAFGAHTPKITPPGTTCAPSFCQRRLCVPSLKRWMSVSVRSEFCCGCCSSFITSMVTLGTTSAPTFCSSSAMSRARAVFSDTFRLRAAGFAAASPDPPSFLVRFVAMNLPSPSGHRVQDARDGLFVACLLQGEAEALTPAPVRDAGHVLRLPLAPQILEVHQDDLRVARGQEFENGLKDGWRLLRALLKQAARRQLGRNLLSDLCAFCAFFACAFFVEELLFQAVLNVVAVPETGERRHVVRVDAGHRLRVRLAQPLLVLQIRR